MRLSYQISVIVGMCLVALVLGLGIITVFGAGPQPVAAVQQTATQVSTPVSSGLTLQSYSASAVPAGPTGDGRPQTAAVTVVPTVDGGTQTTIVPATTVSTDAPTSVPTAALPTATALPATVAPTDAPTATGTSSGQVIAQGATSVPTAAPTQAAATQAPAQATTAASSGSAAQATTVPTMVITAGAGVSRAADPPKRMPVTASSDDTLSSVTWLALIAGLIVMIVIGGLSFRAYGHVLGFADTVTAQFRAIREAARKE